MKRFDGDYAQGLIFHRPNLDILFSASSSIVSSEVGVLVQPSAMGATVTMAGVVTAEDFGFYSTARDTELSIKTTAEIDARVAVLMTGPGQTLDSAGQIAGETNGVLLTGPQAKVVNSGEISADAAVVLQGSDNGRLVNAASGKIVGESFGVVFGNAYADSENQLINLGSISSSLDAFQGSTATDRVTNRGTITGNIFLGLGDDVFNGRRGEIAGEVHGNGGDDRYLVDTGATLFVEQTDSGTDTVVSTVDYRLFDNFETLILEGRADLRGRGNDEENLIVGNAGDNRLYGYGGYNTLAGGAGDDWLLGGTQTDTFVFGTGDGHDIIRNFQDNVDYVDLSKWKGLNDFDVLLSHTKEEGADLIISFRGDQLIIENFTKAQFDIGDFAG